MTYLFMVPLFPNGKRYGQTVAGGRQRARGVGRVRTGRIFQVIEIEQQFPGLVHAVIWESCVQEPAGGVSALRAGCIA